jgi:hypothetical protein
VVMLFGSVLPVEWLTQAYFGNEELCVKIVYGLHGGKKVTVKYFGQEIFGIDGSISFGWR